MLISKSETGEIFETALADANSNTMYELSDFMSCISYCALFLERLLYSSISEGPFPSQAHFSFVLESSFPRKC